MSEKLGGGVLQDLANVLLPLGQGVDWRNKKQPLEKGSEYQQAMCPLRG